MLKLCKNGMIPALIALLAGSAIGEEKWELIKEKDGLKIYTREFPGSDIKELKAVGRIKAPVKRLVDIQFDMQNQTQWVPLCKTARLIKKISDSQVQVYREIDNPWPFRNSDYVVELNLKSDEQTGESTVEFHEVKDAYPAQDCCGRISCGASGNSPPSRTALPRRPTRCTCIPGGSRHPPSSTCPWA